MPYVLFVHADKEKTEIIRELLDTSGAGIMLCAPDIATANGILGTKQVDLILVGEHIGEDLGIEFIWALSSKLNPPPAVLIADEFSKKGEQEARNLSAVDYISWDQLSVRSIARIVKLSILERSSDEASRNNTESLIQQIFELEQSYSSLEGQAGENAQLAEELDMVRSELEDALSEVVRTKEKLEQLNDEKNKLFSIIAHDLRSPLTSVLASQELLEFLGDDVSKEDLMEQLAGVHGNVQIVYSLLENLLEWARIQMDQVAFEPAPCDLGRLAEQTTMLLGPVGAQKSVTVINNVPAETIAYGDTNMVDTIIRNLTNNSVKFTPEGGSVTISAQPRDNDMVISIRDTGVGIPKDRLPTLFVLEKGSTTRGTKGEKGTGLGLILCRDMVEKNHGEIWAESEEGKGSNFFFSLPREAFTDGT